MSDEEPGTVEVGLQITDLLAREPKLLSSALALAAEIPSLSDKNAPPFESMSIPLLKKTVGPVSKAIGIMWQRITNPRDEDVQNLRAASSISEAADIMLTLITDAVWATFNPSVIELGTYCYATVKGDSDQRDQKQPPEEKSKQFTWATINTKIKTLDQVWPSISKLEEFLKMWAVCVKLLFGELLESFDELKIDQKVSADIRKSIPLVNAFATRCPEAVSAIDCNKIQKKEWTVAWKNIFMNAQNLTSEEFAGDKDDKFYKDLEVTMKSKVSKYPKAFLETDFKKKLSSHIIIEKDLANKEKHEAMIKHLAAYEVNEVRKKTDAIEKMWKDTISAVMIQESGGHDGILAEEVASQVDEAMEAVTTNASDEKTLVQFPTYGTSETSASLKATVWNPTVYSHVTTAAAFDEWSSGRMNDTGEGDLAIKLRNGTASRLYANIQNAIGHDLKFHLPGRFSTSTVGSLGYKAEAKLLTEKSSENSGSARVQPGDEKYEIPTMIEGPPAEVNVISSDEKTKFQVFVKSLVPNPTYLQIALNDEEQKRLEREIMDKSKS
ncbi:unnamed protein product, partial [Prorocentrum cordatum]